MWQWGIYGLYLLWSSSPDVTWFLLLWRSHVTLFLIFFICIVLPDIIAPNQQCAVDSKPVWFAGYLKRRGTCTDACQRHYRCSRWEYSQQGGLCFTKNKMCLTCRLICQPGRSVVLRCFCLVSSLIDCEKQELVWGKLYLLWLLGTKQYYWIWIWMC